MPSDSENYRPYASTRWVAAGERLSSSARGKTQHARRAYRWFGLAPLHRSQKVTMVITYRGGPECWYLVEARGRHGVFPGVAALHDVLNEIRQA